MAKIFNKIVVVPQNGVYPFKVEYSGMGNNGCYVGGHVEVRDPSRVYGVVANIAGKMFGPRSVSLEKGVDLGEHLGPLRQRLQEARLECNF